MIRAAALVSAGTLASRVLGFVRDALLAALLGAGAAAEAFVFAFQLVNVARRLLTEGALNAALIPALRRIEVGQGEDAARRFAGEAVATIGLGLAMLAAVLALAMPVLVAALAPGFAGPTFDYAVRDARLMLPYLAFAGPVAVLFGTANADRRFALTALAPALFNAVLIAAIAALLLARRPPDEAGMLIAAMVGVAGVAQLAVLARRRGLARLRPSLSSEIRVLLARAMPAMIVQSAPQLMLVAATVAASATPAAVAWIYFAMRLIELPLGIVGVASGTVLTAELARTIGDGNGHRRTMQRGVELALGVALPAAAGLAALALPIVTLLFQHGAFAASDAAATAQVLVLLAAGLPAHAMAKALAPVALAARPGPAAAAAALAIAATLGAAGLLGPKAAGIALALTLGAWLFAAILAALTPRPSLDFSRLLRIVLAVGIMAAASTAVPLAADMPRIALAAALAAVIAAAALLYLALLVALRVIAPDGIRRALRR